MAIIEANAKLAPRGNKYPGYWLVKKLRKGLRNRLSTWLRQGMDSPPLVPLDPAAIQRIVLCRRNSRLGNTLFLVPLLRALHNAIPQAEIDVLIGNTEYRGLLQDLPGVRQVWSMPARGWAYPFRLLALLRQLRARNYDLAVEPSFNSFGNRLLARLCRARWLLGFSTPDQWLGLTHAVIPDAAVQHDALKPLRLVSHGIAGAKGMRVQAELALDASERAAGLVRIQAALADHGASEDGSGPIIGFFTEATGKKRLPSDWWLAWADRLRRSGRKLRLLQILPPGSVGTLDPAFGVLREPDPRRLAAVLSQLDLFVACDGGPMHLAAAAGTPTLGLFQASRSTRYAPLGSKSQALQVSRHTPADAANLALTLVRPAMVFPRRPASASADIAKNAPAESQRVQRQDHVPAH